MYNAPCCCLLLVKMLSKYSTRLTSRGQKKKFSLLVQKFEEYCIPRKKNVTYKRHLFNTRNQGPAESIDFYVTVLRTSQNLVSLENKQIPLTEIEFYVASRVPKFDCVC